MRNREPGEIRETERGAILLMILMVLSVISTITVYFLYMTSIKIKSTGNDLNDSKAFWLAEAGRQKAVWYLMTPIVSGGKGEDWTTTSVTESLGSGSYNLKVERWDWALASLGTAVSASSNNGVNVPARAIDGNDAAYWESNGKPAVAVPQYITVVFPYTLKLNKARFLSPTNNREPRDYRWLVSLDGLSYSTVLTVTGNTALDRTDEFHPAGTDIKYLRLFVTDTQAASVRIATLEALGNKITATGTVADINKIIEQTVIIDDGRPTIYDAVTYTPSAYNQIDWLKIQ